MLDKNNPELVALCRNYLKMIMLRSGTNCQQVSKEAHDGCADIDLADFVTLAILNDELTEKEREILCSK